MSAPANKAALDRLGRIVQENEKEGDWLYSSLPGSVIPIPVDTDLSPEDIVDLTANQKVPKKPA